MTREQAQEILLLHRPGAAENGPEVAEAIQFAANDPELSQWLEQHREFTANITKQFQAIEPPADLQQRILAGAKAPVERPRSIRRFPLWVAAAAIILLVASVDFWISRNNADARTFANFRSRMTSFALRTYQMDIVTNNAAAVRDYLAAKGAPADFPLTPGLEKLPVKGGGRLSWQNQPVAMMCFALTNNETAFMFVIDQNGVEKPVGAPQLKSGLGVNSVTWTKEGKLYLLAASETPEKLASLAGF
jgi:hypothetical protein